MKTSITFLALLAVMFTTSCKKDNESKEKKNSDQLQGKWEAIKRIEVEYKNDIEVERDTVTYSSNDNVFEFKGDSLLIYSNGDPTNERYFFQFIGDELILRSGSSGYFFAFKWYHNDQMSFTDDETSVNSSGVKRRRTSEIITNRIQ